MLTGRSDTGWPLARSVTQTSASLRPRLDDNIVWTYDQQHARPGFILAVAHLRRLRLQEIEAGVMGFALLIHQCFGREISDIAFAFCLDGPGPHQLIGWRIEVFPNLPILFRLRRQELFGRQAIEFGIDLLDMMCRNRLSG